MRASSAEMYKIDSDKCYTMPTCRTFRDSRPVQ